MERLHTAVSLLAEQCDHAVSQDKLGFNGVDARWGHFLASVPFSEWKPTWYIGAHKMLKKYRKQLASKGLDYSAIPVPTEEIIKTVKPKQKKTDIERTLSISGSAVVFKFPYDTNIIGSLKGIKGWFNPRNKTWAVTPTPDNINTIATIADRFQFQLTPEFLALVRSLQVEKENIIKEYPLPTLKRKLRPFQEESLKYFTEKERILIADEMGLGKTAQAIACIEMTQAFPCLVICPASLKYNWQNEINAWTDRQSSIINGYAKIQPNDFVVINYDILERNKANLQRIRWGSLICDESHYIKNPKANRTKVVKEVAKNISHRILLTGTPCLNRPVELTEQLDVLGYINEFGGRWNYLQRYCNAYHNGFGWDFTGASNTMELNTKLLNTCYIRRRKDDVLKELPAKTYSMIHVELTNAADYNRAVSNFKRWMNEQGRELSNDAIHLTKMEELKKIAAQGKMKDCLNWIRDFLNSGEKLVVFAHHVEIQKILIKQFPECASVLGEYTAKHRQENVDRFQNDSDCKLIVCSLQAAGVGITLTAASNVAFLEFPWTPGQLAQATDRVHRIGQEYPVNVWYLVAKGTIEESIIKLLSNKEAVTNSVHDGIAIDSNTNILAQLIQKMKGE